MADLQINFSITIPDAKVQDFKDALDDHGKPAEVTYRDYALGLMKQQLRIIWKQYKSKIVYQPQINTIIQQRESDTYE